MNGPAFAPTFDGAPEYQPIVGTPLSYTTNASMPIIQVDANTYYAVNSGVWFTATAVGGPWRVATAVPEVIYTIPTSSMLLVWRQRNSHSRRAPTWRRLGTRDHYVPSERSLLERLFLCALVVRSEARVRENRSPHPGRWRGDVDVAVRGLSAPPGASFVDATMTATQR